MNREHPPFVPREGIQNLHLGTDAGDFDFLGTLPEIGDSDFARAHSTPVQLPFGACRLLDLQPLIASKEVVGRDKDFLVAAQLRAILDAVPPDPDSP